MDKIINKERKWLLIKPADWVWVHLLKDSIPTQIKSKLIARGDCPIQVIERMNNNSYKIDLPQKYQVYNTFTVSDLSLFDRLEDNHTFKLRSNSSRDEEDDTISISSKFFTRVKPGRSKGCKDCS